MNSELSGWFRNRFIGLTDFLDQARIKISGPSGSGTAIVPFADPEIARMVAFQRQELIAKLLSTILGLAVSLGISFYGIRWLMNNMDPTKKEKEEAQKRAKGLMKSIGVGEIELSEYELCIASNLVDPLTLVTDWKDIGGLQSTVDEIRETLINPFKHKKLYSSTKLIQTPKGVLLYGPPGCGKTMLAKAIAKETGARFINLQVSSLVDKWYGESQKRAEAVFSLAKKIQPTIIFIDEIDSFLRARSSQDHEATSMIKTQFMTFWDGLTTDNSSNQIVIIGATNRPTDVDSAILRRMPCMFNVQLPDINQRKQILNVILKNESVNSSVNIDELSIMTDGWSGSDLKEFCRTAAIYRVRELLKISETGDSVIIPTSMGELMKIDFERALERMSQSKKVSVAALQQQYQFE